MRFTVIGGCILALVCVLGCGDDEVIAPGPVSDRVFSRSATDTAPDQDPSFIDIVEVAIEATEEEIVLHMQLRELPAIFTYAHASLPDNRIEYDWSGIFDLDDNGVDENDISLSLLYFKPPGATESQGLMTEFCQCNIWEYSSPTGGRNVANANATVTGNTVTLMVSRDAHTSLQTILRSTPVLCTTHYNDGFVSAGEVVLVQ